jgi:hypothetical protein
MSTNTCSNSPLSGQAVMTRFLAWLYGEDALFRSATGLTYPLHVRSWVDQPKAVGQVLGKLCPENRQFPRSSWLLAELQSNHKHLWNGKTYALADRALAPDTKRDTKRDTRTMAMLGDDDRLHCTVGSYFDTVNTCTILEVELERAIARSSSNHSPTLSPAQLYQALPLRRQLHGDRRGHDALLDAWSGRDRSAAVAISCCFVVNTGSTGSVDHGSRGGTHRYFLRQRSAQVADGAGQYHIVPSMVFQPTQTDPFDPESYSLTTMILREIAEELFDREEGDQDYDCYPEITDLKYLLNSGGAMLGITGVAMDLLCLRPEVLALFWVQDDTWFQRHGASMRFSRHEYAQESHMGDSWRSIEDDHPFQSSGEFAPGRCVATGAASALLGTQYLRSRLEI